MIKFPGYPTESFAVIQGRHSYQVFLINIIQLLKIYGGKLARLATTE
jgi:hypothetical protein